MDMALVDQLIYGGIASMLALLIGIYPRRFATKLLAHLVVGLVSSVPVAIVIGVPALITLWGVLIVADVSTYLMATKWDAPQRQH